jgi:NAD(P)-dependent dehydrogenase (short-subunit alcohol dehydrogenase family)
MIAYCMSKAAVAQLTRCAASELASKGIRVNAVCPGVIDFTRIFQNAGFSTEFHDLTIERVKSSYPLGRAGTPEEVAKSIAFLASEEQASFMTGVTLAIDGGRCVSS